MASNQFYIVNQPTPSLVKSGSYECKEGAVRLTCTGMGATGNAVQVWVGPPVTGVWQNLVRYGVPVIMSNNMTQYVEVLAGRYRIDPTGLLGTAIVYVQEDDETDHDDKIVVTYSQQNNNQNGITAESTTTNAAVGNGTNATPVGFNVIVSPDVNNGLSVHPNGLYAASAPPPLNITDATALANAFLATVTGVNTTVIPFVLSTVTTSSNAVYISATSTASVNLTSAFGGFHVPLTMPAQGSIGATNLSLVTGGVSDHNTAAALLSYAGIQSIGFINYSASGATIDATMQVILTLQ